MNTCTSRPTASARSTLRCPAGSRVSPKSEIRAGRSTIPGSSRNRSQAPSTRSAGSGTRIRSRSRRQSSACHTPSTGTPASSPRAQARTISGRCKAYRSNSSARCRTALNRRARRAGSTSSPDPPRCAAKLANHGSPRHPSTTWSRAHTARSGSQGSASASIPDAVATASPTSLRGDGNSTFAHTPSLRPSPAPSRSDIRCASHRSMPRVGTATTSAANGLGSASASITRSASTRPSARSARWTWSTSESLPGGELGTTPSRRSESVDRTEAPGDGAAVTGASTTTRSVRRTWRGRRRASSATIPGAVCRVTQRVLPEADGATPRQWASRSRAATNATRRGPCPAPRTCPAARFAKTRFCRTSSLRVLHLGRACSSRPAEKVSSRRCGALSPSPS